MTTKYDIDDEVLVRAKVIRFSSSGKNCVKYDVHIVGVGIVSIEECGIARKQEKENNNG